MGQKDPKGNYLPPFRLTRSTGINISPDKWEKKAQHVKRSHPDSSLINMQLESIRVQLESYIVRVQSKEQSDPKKCLSMLTNLVDGKNEETIPQELVAFAEEWVWRTRRKRRYTSTQEIRVVINQLEEFKQTERRSLEFADINEITVEAFAWFLVQKKRNVNETVKKKVNYVRSLLKAARNEGARVQETALSYSYKGMPHERNDIALDRKDLQSIKHVTLPTDSLNKVRDVFLFMCYTGLRYSDYYQLEPTHQKISGKTRLLEVYMKKTKKPVRVPLVRQAQELWDKYSGQLPKYSNQRLNQYTKEVAKLAGLYDNVKQTEYRGNNCSVITYKKWELVSCHVGRRTWATLAYQGGLPLEAIRQVLGHHSISQTEEYLRISNDHYDNDILKLWEDI